MLTIFMAVAMVAGCGSSSSATSGSAGNGSSTQSGASESSQEQSSPAESTNGTESSAATKNNNGQTSSAEPETGEEQSSAEEETTGSGKTLVVYFSATGNTAGIAEEIADSLDGTLFEIQPKEPYTDDDLNYNDADSRVSKEHEDASLQNVELKTTKVPNWDSYDTVFIGYPIWWGEAAWPVTSFVKANDFSGKTVIPFCTSVSSDIGDSGSNLASAAGTGEWLDGQRFAAGTSEDEVSDWISTLKLSIRE